MTASEATGYGSDDHVVAMYDTEAEARSARDRLIAEGVPDSQIELVSNASRGTATGGGLPNEGFWGSLKSLFVPGEDAALYEEGVRRGHAMLIVRPERAMHERVVQALEATMPLDLDAREAEWNVARGTATGAGAAGTMQTMGQTTGQTAARTTAQNTTQTTTGTVPGLAGAAQAATGRTEERIPVVEERLRIGKRQVSGGKVRVRSYVVERPVEEQVTLREERARVERTRVDRPAGDLPADAFRERTIEVSTTTEEPVVSKEARIVEEVAIRKEASERTETVRDTVRRTEVKVEGDGTADAGTRPVTDPKATPRR